MSNELTIASSAPNHRRLSIGLVILVLALLAPGVVGLIYGRYLIGIAALLAPIPFLFLAHRHYAFGFFLLSLAAQYSFPAGSVNVHPYDLAMGVLLLAMLVEALLKGKSKIESTPFDSAWLFLAGATFVSAVLAYSPTLSIVPLFRIVAIYLCYRIVYILALELTVRRILVWLIGGIVVLSVINILLSIAHGGSLRVFGPMGTPFNGFAITALPMSTAFYIWSTNRKERFWFGLSVPLILFGILATQSRAPLLAVLIVLPILLLQARRLIRERAESAPARRIRRMFFGLIILAGGLILAAGAFFLPLLERVSRLVDSMTSPRGTIALRVVLWTSALKAFVAHPLLGIGIGNFKLIDQIVPSIRLEPIYYYIRGLTAHSLALQYLCETGLIGFGALMTLVWRGLTRAKQALTASADDAEIQVGAALWIASVTVLVSLFFIGFWTWTQGGYFLAILFALNAAWFKQTTSHRLTDTDATQITNLR